MTCFLSCYGIKSYIINQRYFVYNIATYTVTVCNLVKHVWVSPHLYQQEAAVVWFEVSLTCGKLLNLNMNKVNEHLKYQVVNVNVVGSLILATKCSMIYILPHTSSANNAITARPISPKLYPLPFVSETYFLLGECSQAFPGNEATTIPCSHIRAWELKCWSWNFAGMLHLGKYMWTEWFNATSSIPMPCITLCI